ncbi:hypothetical protein BU15DRAFT_79254 [Melanogaster broomeanus]|nr:hypothetical protein BU15DRAFT_79254 [Melanogaster broomeanus]
MNSAYQLRMPSLSNKPSPRYSKGPETRLRTLCDSYQPHDLDSTCVHCQECKRDTVGKRLLAFRYRQQSYSQHTQLLPFPRHGALEGDEDDNSLWDEVAAVTSTVPLPIMRTGSSCAAAVTNLGGPCLKDLRGLDDGGDAGGDGDYSEIPGDDLLTNESVTLFRGVSVY